MPVLTLQIGQGQTTPEQKEQLIQTLASDASAVTGIPVEKFITFIDEYPLEAIGLGSKSIQALREGR